MSVFEPEKERICLYRKLPPPSGSGSFDWIAYFFFDIRLTV